MKEQMPRIVFVNLHCNGMYVKTLNKYITKTSSAPKHRFYLDYLLNHGYQVGIYINDYASSLSEKLYLPQWLHFLFKLECKLTLKLNQISHSQIDLIMSANELKSEDILIGYLHFPRDFSGWPAIHAHKWVNLVHFYGKKEIANLIKNSHIDGLISETELWKYSDLYKKNYDWFHGNYLLTKFTFQKRFVVKKAFSERKHLAVAMGTVTKCLIPEFVDYYHDSCYQPLRLQILEKKEELTDVLDCYISEYQEEELKVITEKDNFLIQIYKKIYNRFHTGTQKKYFSFDMVEKFNDYQMCIVPEDIHGTPGIGFVEGMACGCAYIGYGKIDYSVFGMKENVHYISYDGSLSDLKNKIEYYQSHQEELKTIAEQGCQLIRKEFSEDYVAKELFENIVKANESNSGK